MLLPVLILLSVGLVRSEAPSSTSSYLTALDKTRLKEVIEPGFKLEDASAVYYAVAGYDLLGEAIPKEVCGFLTQSVGDGTDVTPETAFYVASAWKIVATCPQLPKARLVKSLTAVIEKDASSLAELYYATSSLSALSHKLPTDKVANLAKTLQAALRKDDSLSNLGYAFHVASELSQAGSFALDRIEDAVIQADEVDGRYLQFEGGLSVTSFLVNGIYKLSTALNKKPPISPRQTVKLANYFLSRLSVQTPKGVYSLLWALTTLATNAFEKPICVTLAEGSRIVSNEQPSVTIKVCDILGRPLPSVPKVIANSATRVGDDAVVLNEESLQASPTDKTLFAMDFMKVKPDRGFYKIAVSAATVTNVVMVKVLTAVTVDYLEIGTGDADQTTQLKLTKVAYPARIPTKIEADSQQKLVIRFLLRDIANKKPMRVHQAFVRLSSVLENNTDNGGHEIIFVAEPDASHVYKFDMHIGSAASNFGHQSGDYEIKLIVGDAVVSNPFEWTVATGSLKFPEPIATESVEKSAPYRRKSSVYGIKPEIKHMFREPEKRPPPFVSNLFTGLCLAPVLLLFALWFKLGVNISNFPLSLSAVAFHLGLGSIFALFGIFWLKLNMFVTLRYLMGLGVVTFLAGNKLLSRIAQRHKSSR